MDNPDFHLMTVRLTGGPPPSLRPRPDGPQPHTPTTIYRSTTKRSAELFQHLPDELLEHILDFLTPETGSLLTVDQRASLTVESFASAPVHSPDEVNDVKNFRGMCKRFFYLGRRRLFARVDIRFSLKGLKKLQMIASDPKLSQDIRKLSYMVHNFYPQNETLWTDLLREVEATKAECQLRLDKAQASETDQMTRPTPEFRRALAELERSTRNKTIVTAAKARADEQNQIIQHGIDETSLLLGLKALKNLQQIRLMRNVDGIDSNWRNFLNARRDLPEEFVASKWSVVCEHATRTLGRAYLDSGCKAHRLSSRFMDPQSPLLLTNQAAISSLATQLTCLELQFDDPTDLNGRMLSLSEVFRTLVTAARKMEGLHISFLRPVSIPLETIFHDITWPNLLYIGFSGWILSSNEIIAFTQRHHKSLRSVRLREVRLKTGKWIEVLKFIRRELKLKWISLRQVGYEPKIGGGPAAQPEYGGGFAFMRNHSDDDYEISSSENSDEIVLGQHDGTDDGAAQSTEQGEFGALENNDSGGSVADEDHLGQMGHWDDAALDETEPPDNEENEADFFGNSESGGSIVEEDDGHDSEHTPPHSVAGDSEVGVVNPLAIDDQMMVQHSSAPVGPLQDDSLPNCECWNGNAWGDLEDDNGLDPTKSQWKRWEKWVVRGCWEHDPKYDPSAA